jgi:hypothetical protein
MSDSQAPPPRRWKRIFLALIVLIPAVIVAVRPYHDYESFVNRRTGNLKVKEVTWYVIPSQQLISHSGYEDIQQYGAVTAPDEDLSTGTMMRRFPWSELEDYGDQTTPRRNQRIRQARQEMFNYLVDAYSKNEYQSKSNVAGRINAIIENRLAIWNSSNLLEEYEAARESLLNENKDLEKLIHNR